MQEHAVPRDITGFKFKLVGDMTVKQFGELAFGAVTAYIILASGIYPIFKWPLGIFFALFGVALAFLPIQERPLDVWIINFFKAIYRPTYFVWKKDLSARTVNESDFLPGYLNMDSITQHNPSKATVPVLQTITTPVAAPSLTTTPFSPTISPIPQQAPQVPTQGLEQDSEEKRPENIARENSSSEVSVAENKGEEKKNERASVLSVEDLMKLREKEVTNKAIVSSDNSFDEQSQRRVEGLITIDRLVALREQKNGDRNKEDLESQSKKEADIARLSEKVKDLMLQIDEIKNKITSLSGNELMEMETKLNSLTDEKNKYSAELSAVRKELSDQRALSVALPEYKESPNKVPIKARVVKPKVANPSMATIRLTDLPNVINGLVVDGQSKPIEGAILIIKDSQGNPIRAFKTNKIGQFVVSTPMQNGTYYLELEKQGMEFDTLEVSLDGSILEPLTINGRLPSTQVINNG